MVWGSEIEIERRLRIKLSLYAYAYEYENDSLIDDGTYDELSRKVNPKIKTGHKVLDKFFATEFSPDTGMWIHNHPDLQGLRRLYNAYKNNNWTKRILETVAISE